MQTHPVSSDLELDDIDRAVEDARLWRELIDRLIERGESLHAAIGVADDLMHARHVRRHSENPPSEPPRSAPGGEEPLG